jgi:hypothetical protein
MSDPRYEPWKNPRVDDLSRQRAKRNESFFRTVNEEIDDQLRAVATRDYVCECIDVGCAERVRLRRGEYEAVRAGGDRRFLVVPGHEAPDVERVVERHDGYVVVEKLA